MNSPATTTLDDITGTPGPVVSVAPIALSAPGRAHDLEVRVSAPIAGRDLPIILLSHGNGGSLDGYAPLVDFWAARGFVVIQPTHLDSRRSGIALDDSRFARIWLDRAEDISRILDQLDTIEASVPDLRGRIDRGRIAAVGHSWGAQTIQMLLGARVLDAHGQATADRADARVKAGVLLAATGIGGTALHPFAADHFPFMNPSFAELTTPTLVVAGDRDQSPLSSRGPDWFTDAYRLSPGATDLLTVFDAEHSLGGIAGYEVAETTDEDPARVALIQRVTWAYLRSALYPADDSWNAARSALERSSNPRGRIDHEMPA